MAKLKVFTLDNLTLYDELIKGYIDAADAAVDAKSLKAVALDGNVLKIYNVSEPVGNTAPVYSIELPQTDLTDVLTRLTALEDGKADKSSVYTKGEVDAAIEAAEYDDTQVKADIKANADAITAINNADTGILAQAKAYADGKDDTIAAAKKAGDDAQADVDALEAKIGTVEDGKTVMGIIADIQANAYDDTAIKADIKANTDAIAAINNADTGILAQSKEYTNTTVANAVADVKAGLASALTYKGQKATEDELPTEGNVCGDVWNVVTTDKGTSAEFVWVVDDVEAGTGHWEELGTALDLSAYAEKGQVATDIATAKGEAIAAAATDATTKANQALADAKTYADGLASNYDAAGAADDALTEAKAYTDTEVDKANAAVTALADGQVKTNTEAIAKNAEDIEALQSTLGEGVEAISEAEINALFA